MRLNQSTTNRLEYLSNSIDHDLGLIELDPVTAVWNNDDLAVRGKARHRLLLHRLGCGGIASRQNDQRHVTVSAARSNLGVIATENRCRGWHSCALACADQ